MDIDDIIGVHHQWTNRLEAYAKRPDRSLASSEVACADLCPVGNWLASDGLEYSHWPGYRQLISDHARFHRATAALVARADAGEDIANEIAPGSRSEYIKAANALITSLMCIKMGKRSLAGRTPAAKTVTAPSEPASACDNLAAHPTSAGLMPAATDAGAQDLLRPGSPSVRSPAGDGTAASSPGELRSC